MFDSATIFSNPTRFKVLRTLYISNEALPLRQISYLIHTPVFSVQRALKQLTNEKLIIQKKQKSRSFFSLNTYHPYHSFLTQLFELEIKTHIALRANMYHEKAERVLKFCSEVHELFSQIKS